MLDQITSDNLGVVTDFDRILTRGAGGTAFSVFKSCLSIPEGLKRAHSDNNKFFKIENLN